MTVKEILENLFTYLPDELTNDELLNELWTKTIMSCKKSLKPILSIRVEPSIYAAVIKKLDPNYFYPSSNNEVLHFMVVGEKTFIWDIKYVNEGFKITVKINDLDLDNIITIDKLESYTRVETTSIRTKNNTCVDFDCDVSYYDENYEPLDSEMSKLEAEKDLLFADYFKVPLSSARLFRQNFSYMKNFINTYRTKTIMALNDVPLDSREAQTFEGPFKLLELGSFILKRVQNYLYDTLKDSGCSPEDAYNYEGEGLQVFDNLVNNLSLNLGEGSFIASSNLIENLSQVLDGNIPINGIRTKGYFIARENNCFIGYIVFLEGEKVAVIKEELNDTTINNICKNNENNPEIISFFTDNRHLS